MPSSRVLSDSGGPVVFDGVPTFFRASCWEAAPGGIEGYHAAGWNLAIHVQDLLEPADDADRVAAKLDELEELVRVADECAEANKVECDEDVIRWFGREFPQCMALVPQRRRRTFLKGVRAAAEEDRVYLF
jgi:hypothetical protein